MGGPKGPMEGVVVAYDSLIDESLLDLPTYPDR